MKIRNKRSTSGRPFYRQSAAILFVLFLSGCATTSNVQQIDVLESVGENPKIVLMPPDIKYYLLTASGVAEAHVEWTEAARENFSSALVEYTESIGSDLAIILPDELNSDELKYEALHSAVGSTLLNHHFGIMPLPSKNGKFDWSLGPGISSIGQTHEADYALFVYYRDYQASGGRVALSILAALAGGAIATGSEHGFASLVDLKTGDIVWFNVVRAGSGELRNKDSADLTVAALFKNIPTARDPGSVE